MVLSCKTPGLVPFSRDFNLRIIGDGMELNLDNEDSNGKYGSNGKYNSDWKHDSNGIITVTGKI